MLRTYDEEVCCVCGRQASGLGYRPPRQHGKPIAHCCGDMECLDIAVRIYEMKQEQFNRIEALATLEGGNHGGAYLETIGKTDLTQLTTEEWEEFLKAVVAGYRVALKTKLKDEVPF